jgi:hypothetical protein
MNISESVIALIRRYLYCQAERIQIIRGYLFKRRHVIGTLLSQLILFHSDRGREIQLFTLRHHQRDVRLKQFVEPIDPRLSVTYSRNLLNSWANPLAMIVLGAICE